MKRRRDNRGGSIFQRQQDGRWVGQLYVRRDGTGRKRFLRVYGGSRTEVQERLTAALHERHRGTLADPSKENLGQFLERWLRDSVRRSVRASTFDSYAHLTRKHIIPELGRFRLARLTPAHVQALYTEKLEAGLSPRYVQYMHAVLHRALKQAVRWGLVARNVTEAVDRPRAERKEMRVLTPEQADALLEATRADRLAALYVLAITTGMRQGELFGLTWGAIDLEAGRLQVTRQLQYLRGGKGPELLAPKTKAARRSLELPQLALEALREHRRRQLEERLALGPVWQDEWDLVFTTEVGTPLHPSNVARRSFRPLLVRAGLPRIRFHDLRHTAATLLLAGGEHPKVVQERLGHSSIALTLDTYSHVLPVADEQAAHTLARVILGE